MDGIEGKTPKAKLEYPFEDPPEVGTTFEIAPGVHWVRMPLPFALEWINLWLIEDGDGWTMVDTGIGSEETRQHWRTIFEDVLQGKPITRVVVTHMHPDHVGLAGWVSRKHKCMLHMSRLEYISCRMLVADTGREAPKEGIQFYKEAGWTEEAIENYKSRFGRFGNAVSRLPESYVRLSDGQTLRIGKHDWKIIVGSGHSPEHACLYCPALNVFISGDQLLPRISSNVSVFPTEPNADPLTEWLESCAKLKSAIPEDVLVLPAHNLPFRGAHKRLQGLIDGHEKALKRLKSRLSEPKPATSLFGAIFAREIGPDILSLATGETLAHLNCLISRGDAERINNGDGPALYRAIS